MLWKAGCPGATPQSARPGRVIRIESVGATEATFTVMLTRPWVGVSVSVSREGRVHAATRVRALVQEGDT